MNITIIGFGYVGKAFDVFFSKKHDVAIYDIRKIESDKYTAKIKKSDLYVICVPTDENEDGSVDLSCVNETFEKIHQCDDSALVLLKSTVPPTTTEQLQKKYSTMHIVFSPEYIGESSYYLGSPYNWSTDVIETPFFIFGGNPQDTSKMVSIFQEIAGPNKQYFQASSKEAEITKYMENTFFASKIVFCNEFFNICKLYNVDYNIVRELWLADTRINKNHTLVFNQDKPYCFGGKCFPKDLAGIIYHTEENGYSPQFLKSVKRNNRKPSSISMLHRIASHDSNLASIYYARKMCTTIYEVEKFIESKLNHGNQFGSIQQCLEHPNKYFLLSFDDGYKEHLDVARFLKAKFNIPKYSMLFSISTDFMLNNSYGMDNLYALAQGNNLIKAYEYFGVEFDKTKGILEQIEFLKPIYTKKSTTELREFYRQSGLEHIHENFLTEKEIKELAQIGTICSHGMSHRNLTFHRSDSIKEVEESKNILQEIINQDVNIFCYPEGAFNSSLTDAIKKHYKYGLAIEGLNDPYSISRTNGV